MDSKLVVEQMSGRWKVKHPDMTPLHQQATALSTRFDRITYTWIPRAKNSHADRLANEAMDAAAEIDGRRSRRNSRSRRPRRSSRGLDRRPRRADPVPAAAARADRIVGAAAVFRPRQPGADRPRPAAGRGRRAVPRRRRGGIAAVITSPLQRAYDTAATAAKALGLDVTVDDDLIETDFGDWEGLTFGEAAERDPELHRKWLRDTSVTPPDGESFDSVAERVRRARARIIAEHGGETVLVVSHVTPIKTLLRMALDAGPGILYRLHLDLASLSIAEFYPDGAASVRLVNQTAYL